MTTHEAFRELVEGAVSKARQDIPKNAYLVLFTFYTVSARKTEFAHYQQSSPNAVEVG